MVFVQAEKKKKNSWGLYLQQYFGFCARSKVKELKGKSTDSNKSTAFHRLTIAPTASSLLLGFGSFLYE
jgi:hypothetical protein